MNIIRPVFLSVFLVVRPDLSARLKIYTWSFIKIINPVYLYVTMNQGTTSYITRRIRGG
jgi:hypothetical protein